jgi:hypothetical protein
VAEADDDDSDTCGMMPSDEEEVPRVSGENK